ncbi:uncharacterized protein LTR77_005993 [Saxophila tyrrhenica]|uniref:Expansin-like EG45 domain-containing protein n=1 Tax=Saxophila tyrrhenica TaxID=1690608 RepID=A0AAV9PA52_9PEZI|nr:hypothetical protein LTR77_005993 [Saxophila tyrrhenica]
MPASGSYGRPVKMLSLLTLTTLFSAALAAAVPAVSIDERSLARRALSGEATFYGGNVHGGMCSFSTYNLPKGLYGTALSDSNWNNGANCGGCVKVSHGGKSITAMIVDQCPGCGPNHLDLFPDAFSKLAPPSQGIIGTNWHYVKCPHISGPLSIHMKSGVSKYWFSAQVVNANHRVSKMEVSTNKGRSWQSAKRTEYNFFEISSGVGASSAWIRVTSNTGHSVVVQNVPMTANATKKAKKNFK